MIIALPMYDRAENAAAHDADLIFRTRSPVPRIC